jgi:hypothetical protein
MSQRNSLSGSFSSTVSLKNSSSSSQVKGSTCEFCHAIFKNLGPHKKACHQNPLNIDKLRNSDESPKCCINCEKYSASFEKLNSEFSVLLAKFDEMEIKIGHLYSNRSVSDIIQKTKETAFNEIVELPDKKVDISEKDGNNIINILEPNDRAKILNALEIEKNIKKRNCKNIIILNLHESQYDNDHIEKIFLTLIGSISFYRFKRKNSS